MILDEAQISVGVGIFRVDGDFCERGKDVIDPWITGYLWIQKTDF